MNCRMSKCIGDGPHRFTCTSCQHHFQFMDPSPQKKNGITMHMGERFCMAAKKPRRFKRSDPKMYAPFWCPKAKSPRELRIYGFKSTRDWFFHQEECRLAGKDVLPSGWRYAVEYELHTDLTAQDFWKGLRTQTAASLLGAVVHRHHVVEIDDGVKPVFFYCTDKGFQVLHIFNADEARKNKKED